MKKSPELNHSLLTRCLILISCGSGREDSKQTERENFELSISETYSMNGVGCTTSNQSSEGLTDHRLDPNSISTEDTIG